MTSPPGRLLSARELEEACDFRGAARAALREKDPRNAVRLASLADDRGTLTEAIDELCEGASNEELVNAAEDLLQRGFGNPAGELFEAAREDEKAGAAFAVGGDAERAAAAFERAKKPAEGAKALERKLREDPGDESARLALARLLARHGRTEAAVKTIQAMRTGTKERRLALPLLSRSLRALGLTEAALEIEREMEALGIPVGDATGTDATAIDEAKGAVFFGRYELVRDVAKTPNARVVEATDRITGARVAIKTLSATASEGAGRDAFLRFEREARALSQLKHPSVVPLLGYYEEGPAMVLEWMTGGSLADLLKRETLAPARAAEIAVAVLAALGEAHRLGILHRDVKPANVLFDGIGAPRLSDFGAAHLGDLSATATAAAIGTLVYMSPEQRVGRPATVASDLYAVGAIFYEMLTGVVARPLTDGFVEGAPSHFHVDLGDAHDRVIATLLAEDPSRRPRDAFEARKLVEGVRWSARVIDHDAPASVRTRSSRPPELADQRVGPVRDVGDGRDAARSRFDRWFERDVIVVPIEELERVRAFARAGHPTLPTVLRVIPDAGEIWIARPSGRALADGATLGPALVARLAAAIARLHECGGAHGALDAEHVYRADGEVYVAYPRRAPDADAVAADRAALGALAGR